MRVPRGATVGIGLLLLAACSSPYMKDRGRDGADVFTLTVGYGLGAKARAGPVTAAARERAEFSLHPDHRVALVMRDRMGQTRAQLALDADGSPSLKFADKDGNVTYGIPK